MSHAKILVDGLYDDISRRIEEKTSKKLLDSSFSISKSESLSRENYLFSPGYYMLYMLFRTFGLILFKLVDRGFSFSS